MGTQVKILVRINPNQVPKQFGAQMSRKPSQFGIDEEDLPDLIPTIMSCSNLELVGWHIYSGNNCLDADGIVENFQLMAERFIRYSDLSDINPEKLIFGSGFGIPTLPTDGQLDLQAVAEGVNPVLDQLCSHTRINKSEFILEIGRWIVGPYGYLLTSVIGEKSSRGVDIRLCDAGFNNQLAACGMMGSVFRRN